ncbi:MAG: amidohydrolase family protein [Ignavibacteriae bacterium]|nr:amidohydrolase family protein [Ignavibacteria bacterium]MBI3365291.1 amidohydrolase family protein [Ignavibacteriota bacterium]
MHTSLKSPCHIVYVVVLNILVSATMLIGQIRPAVGIRQNTPSVHAFTNTRIVIAPGKVIERGTLVIRDGVITAVGVNIPVPADARVWDMSGMTLYPGFIDSYSDIGVPKKPIAGGPPGQDQPKPQEQQRGGPKHWNDMVLSSLNADELFSPDTKAAEKLRGMGFTAALIVPQKGIFRGTGAVVSLGDGATNQLLLKRHVAQCIAFETSSGDDYPGSLMGSIALIRQTFLDAQWHKQAMQAAAKYPDEPRPEFVADLAALDDAVTAKQPVIVETSDEMSLLRASRIAKEFSLKFWARGSGYEYRQIDAVKATGVPIILPVNFPDPPSVQTPEEALGVSLQELRYWDEAPENPGKLHDAGIPFVFTTATLKDAGSFLGNVRKAIERGLPADAALAALTTIPSQLLGLEKKLGTLDAGKMANIIVADGDIFNEKTKIRETWIDGKRYEVKSKPEYDPRGTWNALLTGAPIDSLSIILKGEVEGLQGNVKAKGKDVKLTSASSSDLRIALSFLGDSIGLSGIVRMTATSSGKNFLGSGELADGKIFKWNANRTEPFKPEADTAKPKLPVMASFKPVYPPGAFGRSKLPAQPDHLLIRGATIWTCGPQGKLENANILVEHGKITKVGQNLATPVDAVIIDGKGKHITPGLIDCHSHSAAEGNVNEANEAISAEVRIGDILDPYDISIYRELAGGLTAANVLHGSANAIGGQNQVIKLRWGALPEEMKFEGAMPGIKFALGENPKQSNWGDKYTTRYPQTRQGVEQIIRDEFRAALDYEKTWKEFESGKRKIPPRHDLRAETILEILKGKRLVHSHSYRQDEIEMLMRVAEDFGFRVATFQHVLEGYKVADQIAKHGAGASTFSDWWGYKFEVYDAIPYNGAIMHDAGVVVSFNSDSDEQARRLNTEAAKAVKYGGLSEEEALKFVTINPAQQLRIDKRVGSIEVGKDADLAIWNGNPLSTYSICEQTWIDGRKYFDRDEDRAMNGEVQHERAALIQKALGSKKGSGSESKSPPSMGEKERYSCHDDVSGKEER